MKKQYDVNMLAAITGYKKMKFNRTKDDVNMLIVITGFKKMNFNRTKGIGFTEYMIINS